MNKIYTLILLVFLISLNGLAQTTLTLQPDSTTGNDASIYSIYPSLASPTGGELDALAWTASSTPFTMRGLVNFDLSSIPSGAVVQSATLTLYNDPDAANGYYGQQSHLTNSDASWLQRVTTSWNQNTVTWNNQPSVTTLNEASLPEDTAIYQDYIVDVTTLTQDMVNNPSSSFGFMLRLQDEQSYSCLVFGTSNNPVSARHPKLVITYTMPCVSLVLQPDSTTGNDASIYSIYPSLASPTGGELDALAWTASSTPFTMRGLVNFDLSSIPSGAVVQSATLTLYNDPDAANGYYGQQSHLTNSDASWLQRVTSSWNQNTVTWNNQPSATTLNEASLPEDTAIYEDYIVDVTTLTQDMVNNPSSSFGFMLRLQDEQSYSCLVFGTSNNPVSARHPKLEICYTSTAGVHELINTSEINIYPNPATDQLFIHTSSFHDEAVTMSVINVLGQVVKQDKEQWSGDESINIKSLSAGVYFLQLRSQGNSLVKRFVKE